MPVAWMPPRAALALDEINSIGCSFLLGRTWFGKRAAHSAVTARRFRDPGRMPDTTSNLARVITVEMCLAGRELSEPRPSPDGAWLVMAVRWEASSALVLVAIGGGPERLLTSAPPPAPGRGFGGGCFDWLPDSSAVVYAGRDGDLWSQPVPGGAARRISAIGPDRRAEAPCVDPTGDAVVAVVDQAEIWRWPITGGAANRLDDGGADFVFDPHVAGDGSVRWQAWNVPDMPWDASRIDGVSADGRALEPVRSTGAVQQWRTAPDGTPLMVRDDTGWLNVWLGERPLVDEPYEHAEPTWGTGQRTFAVSPSGDRVAFARNESGFGRLCVLDRATGEVEAVARGVHGQLTWVDDVLVALRSGARTPTQVVAYDTATWIRRVLVVGPVSAWDVADLPEPELVAIEHDGVTIHARRYVAGRGRTLCWVHGGPTDQWRVEFMPRVAYWWGQGWDVLVPDPRGSTGHGRDYQQALRGGWGRLDVDDTAAVVAAGHERGWSSPASTVMIGSSSGGLTALGVLGLHRGLACGGVVLYPVTDLAALAEFSHRFEAHYTDTLVGPPGDERYRSHSPLAYADRIDVPLLVMHGDADPVVPIESTLAFVDRMRAAGGDVELVVMTGEGHGFRDPANRRADYDLTAAFLRRVASQPSG
jgi:dipeptidyl aminopeptidase/acylaminoacyl peptidase